MEDVSCYLFAIRVFGGTVSDQLMTQQIFEKEHHVKIFMPIIYWKNISINKSLPVTGYFILKICLKAGDQQKDTKSDPYMARTPRKEKVDLGNIWLHVFVRVPCAQSGRQIAEPGLCYELELSGPPREIFGTRSKILLGPKLSPNFNTDLYPSWSSTDFTIHVHECFLK